MSFSFGSIKSFASRVKESVSSNLDSFKSSTSSSANVKSVKTGFSNMLQSVKESSAAVGKQIAQTAGTLLSKSTSWNLWVCVSSELQSRTKHRWRVLFGSPCAVRKYDC